MTEEVGLVFMRVSLRDWLPGQIRWEMSERSWKQYCPWSEIPGASGATCSPPMKAAQSVQEVRAFSLYQKCVAAGLRLLILTVKVGHASYYTKGWWRLAEVPPWLGFIPSEQASSVETEDCLASLRCRIRQWLCNCRTQRVTSSRLMLYEAKERMASAVFNWLTTFSASLQSGIKSNSTRTPTVELPKYAQVDHLMATTAPLLLELQGDTIEHSRGERGMLGATRPQSPQRVYLRHSAQPIAIVVSWRCVIRARRGLHLDGAKPLNKSISSWTYTPLHCKYGRLFHLPEVSKRLARTGRSV